MEEVSIYQELACPQPSCLSPISALFQECFFLFSFLNTGFLCFSVHMGDDGYRRQLSDGTSPATSKEPECLSQSQFQVSEWRLQPMKDQLFIISQSTVCWV